MTDKTEAGAAEYQLLMSRLRDFQELTDAEETRLCELGKLYGTKEEFDEFFELSCYLYVRKDPVIAAALKNPNSVLSAIETPKRQRKQ
jgi:hypothetical protein